ncbi:MAG: HAD-IA family hydrolase [Legionellaceae bacterium]|nr:HAD-IA family hydrolase [Legionellaceae bacterium]
MYLIFDFDGTLVDSFVCAMDVFNALAVEFNFRKIAEDEKDNLKNLTAKQLMSLLQIPMYNLPAVLYKAKKHMRHEMQYLKPFSGITQVLQELYDAGFNLGIVTSNSEKNVISWLQDHDISQYFQFIKSAPNYFGKAATLKKIIKQKKLPRDDIYYIGDETRDIEAAKQCGIASVAVTWGFNSEKILSEHHPDYWARKPEDMLQLFNG